MEQDRADKMRPLKGRPLFGFGGGYRGKLDIQWSIASGKGRNFEIFGTDCPHCGQAWGWLPDLEKVVKYRRAMERMGCPACPKHGVVRPPKLSAEEGAEVRRRWLHRIPQKKYG